MQRARDVVILLTLILFLVPSSTACETNESTANTNADRRIADLDQKIVKLEREIDKLQLKGDVDKANLRALLREIREELKVWLNARNNLLNATGIPTSPESEGTKSGTPFELADGNYRVEMVGNTTCENAGSRSAIRGSSRRDILQALLERDTHVLVSVASFDLGDNTQLRILFTAPEYASSVDVRSFSKIYLSDDLGKKYDLVSFDQSRVEKGRKDVPARYVDPSPPPKKIEIPTNWMIRKTTFGSREYVGVEKP